MSSQTYSVFPMRFSADPRAMIAFLEALGLHKALDTGSGRASGSGAGASPQQTGGTYAVFEGASGKVAVHGTANAAATWASGDTSLNFTVADVDAAVAELTNAGLAGSAWDETYGKQGSVVAPNGRVVGLNEETPHDLYGGYRVHEQVTAASLDVVAVWYSTDFRRDAAFFAAFGFEPFGSLEDPWWCDLRAGRHAGGVIGLHAAGDDSTPGPAAGAPANADGTPALVRLGFETSEPLDALAARLRDAGHDSATVLDDEVGPRVVVNDPDGRRLEIHLTS